jgi:hypothetical protein
MIPPKKFLVLRNKKSRFSFEISSEEVERTEERKKRAAKQRREEAAQVLGLTRAAQKVARNNCYNKSYPYHCWL